MEMISLRADIIFRDTALKVFEDGALKYLMFYGGDKIYVQGVGKFVRSLNLLSDCALVSTWR